MSIVIIICLCGLIFGFTISNMNRDSSEDTGLISKEIGWTVLLLTGLAVCMLLLFAKI